MQSLMQKQKYLNLGQKLLYLDFFGLLFEKGIVIFEINTLEFLKPKFRAKAKILKFMSRLISAPTN